MDVNVNGADSSGAPAAYARVLLLAAAASGLVIAACFLRFQLWPFGWLAFAPLLWAVTASPDRTTTLRIGWVAGLCTNIPAFYWLVYTIHVFGGFPWIVAVFFYALLSIATSSQFILLVSGLRRTGPGPLALAAPLLWVALEFLFPNLFPWRMAHSQYELPVLMQIGAWTGPYGLSFVMVWFSAAIAQLVYTKGRAGRLPLALAATCALAIFAYGRSELRRMDAELAAAPSVQVALVQGNISIEQKGDVAMFGINLDTYRELSQPLQPTTDLLVWPETVSQYWIPADNAHLGPKENPFPDLATHLLFGGLAYRMTGPRAADEFNSSFLIGPGGKVLGRYDKRILMPFGEYIPGASLLPFLKEISPNTAGFTPGSGVRVWEIGDKLKIGPLICYEDIITSMPRDTTLAGAEVLLTILNDAWYGESAAPIQHQALAIWRTVENRRYLLRGSNTGVTAIIDPAGRIVAQGGLFTTEVVKAAIHPMREMTFYTRFGDVFAWAVVLGSALLLLRNR